MQPPQDQQAMMMAMYQQMLQAQMMQAMAGQIPGMAGQVAAAAPAAAAMPAAAAAPAVAQAGSRTGVCKMWNEEKKFGFLSADDGGEDLFCHKSCLVGLDDGSENLTAGDTVRFDSTYDEAKGKQRATNVSIIAKGGGGAPNGGGGGGGGCGGGGGGASTHGLQKKLKLCTFFEQGACSRGSACTFAHGQGEIGTYADPTAARDGGTTSAGDWTCPSCGDNQFARNQACRKCGAARPADGGAPAAWAPAAAGGGGWGGGSAWQDSGPAPDEPTMKCSRCGMEKGVMNLTNDGAGGIVCNTPCQMGGGGGGCGGMKGGGKGGGKGQKKMRLCTYFEQQGSCQRGNACTFAHGEAELGTYASPDAAAAHYAQVGGKGKDIYGGGGEASAAGGGKGMMPGDWTCPACGDHQFARNTECRKCGGPNPAVAGGGARSSPY